MAYDGTCSRCGNILNHGICGFCYRLKIWERKKAFDIMQQTFTKRIQTDLLNTEIKIEGIVQNLYSMISKEKVNLFLYGGVGSGKTLTACGVLMEYYKNKYIKENKDPICVFVTVPTLLYDIRLSYTTNSNAEEKLIRICESADFMILDDVGVEKATDWALATLYMIINTRYENNNHTIFTSNLDLDQLTQKCKDPRIPSRISGMSEQVFFTHSDYRIG